MKGIYIILIAALLTGCGTTSPFTYHVKPTPLKNSETKYSIGNIDVNLTLGHGAIAGDKTFASDSQLKKQFTQYIKKHLQEKGLLAKSKASASARIDVVVNYKRTFNYGGKSLNKPQISHQIEINRNKEKLASMYKPVYTTKYGYLKDIAVNLEISAFSRDAEDEPEDIELVSKLIADDIANAGS